MLSKNQTSLILLHLNGAFKTPPASLGKFTFDRLKSSKLLPSVVKQGRFLIACLSYFPAHRTRSFNGEP